jgi:peptide-methionine (S)-S-oxide reductase
MVTDRNLSLVFAVALVLAGLTGVVAKPLIAPNGVAQAQPIDERARRAHGDLEIATFAGGCFWCMQPPFDKIEGVVATTPGYTGGHRKNPTYEHVTAGGTGHAEAVQVLFDPAKVSYARLLEVFWRNIDPTTANRQFCDVGDQYRTAVFYHSEAQKRLAEESKAALEKSKPFKGAIVTMIVPASTFYEAEAYHRDYYKKNPLRYKFYRATCGRDQRITELWGTLR